MNKTYLAGVLLVLSCPTFSQTPGLIFKTAGSGIVILDPNGDGYTSATTAGFTTSDLSQSEILYQPLAFPFVEPVSDLAEGDDCEFTDLVDSGGEDPVLAYFDTSGNLLFRFRLGSDASGSKGYSIMIDTDQKFGSSGPNHDPNAVTGNPGFEIEIVLKTNFGVSLYDVDGTISPVLKTTLAYADFAQKSVALTTTCSDPDYFYDFYIPFSTITGFFPSITSSTPLRMVAATSASPAPAIGNDAISDVGGIDDQAYGLNYDAIFDVIINNFYPTPVTGIDGGFPADRSACPSITSTITPSSTSISGTSSEGNGTTINVFKNSGLFGTTTVSSGNWTITGVSGLVDGDIITASATAPGESESVVDCSAVPVGSVCTSKISSVIACNPNRALSGTGVPGAIIRVYSGISSSPIAPVSGNTFSSGTITVDGSGNWLWMCLGSGQTTVCPVAGGPCLANGAYRITQTLSGECESDPVFLCIGIGTTTVTPIITTNPILIATTSVSGTTDSGASIILYGDGVQIGTTTASGTNWTVSGLVLAFGQVITARAIAGINCLSNPSASQTVTSVSATPVISGTYCTSTTINAVSGTTTEGSGTVIEVFSNSVSVGTTASNSNGVWSLTGLSLPAGDVVTATATASGKLVSPVSGSVTIGNKTDNLGLAVNTSIQEGQTSLSGTVSTAGTVKIYVDGAELGVATVAGSIWTLAGLSSTDVYTGAAVTATVTIGGNCESDPSEGVIVQCIAPATDLPVTPASASICQDENTSVTVGSSEKGITYQLYSEAVATGVSTLGSGGDITLTSGALTASTILTVKASKISSVSCISTLSRTHRVSVASADHTSISASAPSIPADGKSTSDITIQLKDASGNITSGICTPRLSTTAGTISWVIDNGNGTYSSTLTSSTTPGTATLTATLNGVPLSDNETVEFTPRPLTTLFIPEGFSPDGDGKNDTFVIQGAEVFTVNLMVYNRWGNVVYESKTYKNDWDGLANHGLVVGDKLPDGTYYYVVDLNNGETPKIRFMTIKRK